MRAITTGLLVLSVMAAPSGAFAGDWEGHNVLDHLRGKIGYGASAKGELRDRHGVRKGAITANCADNKTTVYVGARGLFFGTRDPVAVSWTIDGGPVQRGRWNVCASSDCVGLWHGAGIPLLKSMFGKAMFRIVIERSFAEPVEGTFSIAGAAEEVGLVGKLCGWYTPPKS